MISRRKIIESQQQELQQQQHQHQNQSKSKSGKLDSRTQSLLDPGRKMALAMNKKPENHQSQLSRLQLENRKQAEGYFASKLEERFPSRQESGRELFLRGEAEAERGLEVDEDEDEDEGEVERFQEEDDYRHFDPYSVYGEEDEEEDVWYSEERLFEVSSLSVVKNKNF